MSVEHLSGLDPVVYTAELARWLGQPEGTLRYWRHAGIGPRSFRIGRRVAYRRTDIATWLDERQAADADWLAGA